MNRGWRERISSEPVFFKAASNERGAALMIVLWVLVFLMIITGTFAYTMRLETYGARNFMDWTAAHSLARAGINLGLSEIESGYGLVLLGNNGRLTFAGIEGGTVKPLEAVRELALGEGKISYSIEDEHAKLNINTATREMITSLLESTGVEVAERDIIADSILDWRDENHEYRLNGAENDYYESLPQPYEAKDGLLDTVEELLLVRGVTPEVFFGTGRVPPDLGADGKDSAWGRAYSGIARYLTVKGDGRINLNTAPEPVLEAAFGKAAARDIMLKRSTDGFFEAPLYGGVVTSNIFTIRATGEVRGIKAGIKAIVERKPAAAAAAPALSVNYWNEEGVDPE